MMLSFQYVLYDVGHAVAQKTYSSPGTNKLTYCIFTKENNHVQFFLTKVNTYCSLWRCLSEGC